MTTKQHIFFFFFLVRPPAASVRNEDCSFEKGICGWENITLSTNDRSVTWQRAFLTHRPAQLLDKTFGTTGDYIFFDIYTADQKSTEVQLRSPIINPPTDEESTCFTFWFAAFGVEESTMLQIIRTSDIDDANSGNDENGNDDILVCTDSIFSSLLRYNFSGFFFFFFFVYFGFNISTLAYMIYINLTLKSFFCSYGH